MSHNALIGCYGCLKRRLFKAREEVREGGDLSAGGSDAPTADDRWAAPAEARIPAPHPSAPLEGGCGAREIANRESTGLQPLKEPLAAAEQRIAELPH